MRIRAEGFLPRKPSRKVWFARGKGYADGRAKTQARRAHDRAVTLKCDVDIKALREQLGDRKVFYRNGIIAIDATISPGVLRSSLSDVELPQTPGEITAWVNSVLKLKSHKGPARSHAGVARLSDWVTRRFAQRPTTQINPREMLGKARQWLPEFFEGVEIDPANLQVRHVVRTPIPAANVFISDLDEADPAEERALDCLLSDKPERRAKGLKLLTEIENVDLFEWCAMYLDDDEPDVVVAALRAMLKADEADVEAILPLADSDDNRIRAAAAAALTRHSGDQAPLWFERGLKDPSTCVRMETCARLVDADAGDERLHTAFQLALYDPNPEIRRRAEGLVEGKGYSKAKW